MTVKENIKQLERQVKLPCKNVDIAEDKKEVVMFLFLTETESRISIRANMLQ